MSAIFTPLSAELTSKIVKEHPGRITSRGLMGYSMGGFHTLMLAATARDNPAQLQFDRYLAVDVSVRLLHGIEQLDSFYNAVLEWPASERTDRIDALLRKRPHSRAPASPTPRTGFR